ncbi:hypothetical protein U1Q18_009202 [Sarracenia purpurea var. burkii]
MAFRGGFLLLLLSLAVAAESSFDPGSAFDTVTSFDLDSLRSSSSLSVCNGQVGDCIDEDEEMMMGSEAARRVLAQQRYISYGAMKANNVPCNRRGRSYYNCNQRGKANPYTRGCSYITKCARYSN